MNPAWILADGEEGFHAPTIAEFFPAMIWGERDSWFGFDRIMLVRLVVVAALILLLWLGVCKAKLIPGRGQSVVEMALDFIRVQIAENILGKERARPYLSMLTTIFFTVLAMNLAGVVPGLNIAGTSRMGLPLLLAVWVFLVYLVSGVRKQGFGTYLRTQLFPSGVPPVAYILITPIEFLQVFVLRPLTLALRLLANMMAGHLMLVLCFAGTHALLLTAPLYLKPAGLLAFAGGIFITVFEIFVAALQAYIFTLLASIYINFALEAEH